MSFPSESKSVRFASRQSEPERGRIPIAKLIHFEKAPRSSRIVSPTKKAKALMSDAIKNSHHTFENDRIAASTERSTTQFNGDVFRKTSNSNLGFERNADLGLSSVDFDDRDASGVDNVDEDVEEVTNNDEESSVEYDEPDERNEELLSGLKGEAVFGARLKSGKTSPSSETTTEAPTKLKGLAQITPSRTSKTPGDQIFEIRTSKAAARLPPFKKTNSLPPTKTSFETLPSPPTRASAIGRLLPRRDGAKNNQVSTTLPPIKKLTIRRYTMEDTNNNFRLKQYSTTPRNADFVEAVTVSTPKPRIGSRLVTPKSRFREFRTTTVEPIEEEFSDEDMPEEEPEEDEEEGTRPTIFDDENFLEELRDFYLKQPPNNNSLRLLEKLRHPVEVINLDGGQLINWHLRPT